MCTIPDCPWNDRHIEVEDGPRIPTPDYDVDDIPPAYNEIHNIVERSSAPPIYQQTIDHTLPSYNEILNIVVRSMSVAYDQLSLPSYESTVPNVPTPQSLIIEFPMNESQNCCCDKDNMIAIALGVGLTLVPSIVATLII
ncbi:hypothetical protein HA402_005616 [Bradysia odoriphaga]|nr:hypothetical protein HA402_005616 [Bradysia odoriphaga]